MLYRNPQTTPNCSILRAPAPENTAFLSLALAYSIWLSAAGNISLPRCCDSRWSAEARMSKKNPLGSGFQELRGTVLDYYLEAEVGIEPAYAALQAAA
jgi:hypothetical protein